MQGMKSSSAPSRTAGLFSLRRIAVGVAAACSLMAAPVRANGVDPTVVAGSATFTTAGGNLDIVNSPGAIIHWQGFSIGAAETTRFIQQSADSSVLNRVLGSDSSLIFGTLTSNGRVFLINPAGIVFGEGARIDVAGLVASTLNVTDTDFLANRANFASDSIAGSIDNRGHITTPSGGSVYLVGSNVSNTGIINSPQGDVILAAGHSVKIFDTSTPGVRVEMMASDNTAINLGQILVRSGEVGIYSAALRNAGIIDASQVVRDATGKIVLRAQGQLTLDETSHLTVNGEQAGQVIVQSLTGNTRVAGSVEAIADGAGQVGGTIHILGNGVDLASTHINASGDAAGGTVLVGGDFHGEGAVQTSERTSLDADVVIHADAIRAGKGGRKVIA